LYFASLEVLLRQHKSLPADYFTGCGKDSILYYNKSSLVVRCMLCWEALAVQNSVFFVLFLFCHPHDVELDMEMILNCSKLDRRVCLCVCELFSVACLIF
jgi:hypothetical protein